MVMTVHKNDVQTVGGGIIQHVKDILAIQGIAVRIGTGRVTQRCVRSNEDGSVITLADLVVQPCFQVVSYRLYLGTLASLLLAEVGLVYQVNCVAVTIITAGGVNAGNGSGFVVTLNQVGVIMIQGAKSLGHLFHHGSDTGCGIAIIMGITVVVAYEDKAVHSGVILFDFIENIAHIDAAVIMIRLTVIAGLEITTCEHVDRVTVCCVDLEAEIKQLCRQGCYDHYDE